MDIFSKELLGSFSDQIDLLLKATDGCRTTMHEPDEQGLTAKVIGKKFDNAFGIDVSAKAIIHDYQELLLVLTKDEVLDYIFNLADIVALARYGAWKLLSEKEK